MESPEERCGKRERAEGGMNEMKVAKRHYSEWSSESEGFSELLCKDEEDSFPADLISDIMKSLADEIMSNEQPCNSVPDRTACENVDIEYLLGATDDELGIPPSPNAENQVDSVGENTVADLLDSIGEGPFHLCSSECCCCFQEEDGNFCLDWLATSLNGDSSSLVVDQATLPLAGTGAVM